MKNSKKLVIFSAQEARQFLIKNLATTWKQLKDHIATKDIATQALQ